MSSLIYYYFYSKYSQLCGQVANSVKSLGPYLNIIPIDIDNRAVRQKIMTSNIKTVPCMIVQTPNSIEHFEGQQLLQFIQKTIVLIQQNNRPPNVSQGQTVLYPDPNQVQSIVNPYQPQPQVGIQSVGDTTNARLAPPMITSPPPPPPVLSSQIAQPNAVQQAAILQQQAAQMQQPQLMQAPQQPINPLQVASQVQTMPQQMAIPQQMGVAQQQALLAQGPIQQAVQPDAQQMQQMQQMQQQQQMQQPIMVPGPQMMPQQMMPQQPMMQPQMQPQMQMIDDSVMNQGATFQPQGMSMTDIVGTQGGISRMGNPQGGGGALAAAAAMAAQRDNEDASMNPRNNMQMAMAQAQGR